jgi:two-component system, NarL family, sensor kinase
VRRKVILILLFFCQSGQIVFAQTKVIDSLRHILSTTISEKQKADIYLVLCNEKASITPDSLMHYAIQAKKIAADMHDEEKIMAAEYMIMNAYNKFGLNDTCMQLIKVQLAKQLKEPVLRHLQRKFWVAKGNILNIMNQTKTAQQLFFNLLEEAEKENDVFIQLCVLNGIGWSYQNLKNDSLAIPWYRKGIDIVRGKAGRPFIELFEILESNIGFAYWEIYKVYGRRDFLDSAINHINNSIAITRKYQFLGALASNLGNMALWLNEEKKDKIGAEKLLKEAIAIRNKIGNPYMLILDMAKTGEFYLNTNQPEKGIAICLEGIRNADSANIKSDILLLYELLAKNYKAAGKYKEYGETINKLLLSKDSINKANATKELSEIQTKYDVQKKETLIAQQKLGLFQRKILLYGLVALALITIIFFAFRFKKYKEQQKIKMALMREEEKKQSEMAVKDAEEKERKRIAAELHDNLGVQANAILHNSTLLNEINEDNKTVVADLQETAKEMLLNLRETLWAMKTTDVTAIELWLRIINFMKQMGRHYTNINFKVEGIAPTNFIISSSQALHIVLVLQESVNNSVKHAEAKTITAMSTAVQTGWKITLADDGKGFEPVKAKTKMDNYGLSNMQQRAIEGSFRYTIETAIDKGTITTLAIST